MTSLILTAALSWGAELPVDSDVTAVTVFTDRAQIVRQVRATVPAGRTDLILEGLPIQLVTDSLSAQGEGTTGTVITGIDVRPRRGTRSNDERVAELRDERVALTDQVGAQDDIIARVQGEIAFVEGISPKAPPQLSEPLFLASDAPTQLAGLAAQVGDDLRSLYAEKRAAERAKRDLALEIGRIDRELADLQRQGSEDTLRVAVGLDSPRGGQVTMQVSYLTPGASWTPRYDARYDIGSGRVRLDLAGQVRQNTGEDWEGVSLVLSTATPQQGLNPPELQPFTLGQGTRYGPSAVVERSTAFEFAARRRESVPADGSTRRVPLASIDLDAEVVYHVVARRREAAWLTARVHNETDHVLLPGPVFSYLGTAYVGEGRLDHTAPGEELALSFGVDERVGVERERLEDVSEGARPLGSKERRRWGYVVTVENHTGDDIQVEVHDQVPASREDAFEVEATTTPTVEVPFDGVFTWEQDIPRDGEQEFRVEYEVTWPQDDPPVLDLD